MDNRDYNDEDTFDKQWVRELFFSIVCLPSSEIMLEGNPKLLFPENTLRSFIAKNVVNDVSRKCKP